MSRFKMSLFGFMVFMLAFQVQAGSYQVKHYSKKRSFGYKQTPESKAKMKSFKHRELKADNIPGSADISALVSLPEDQGTCGSCWSFALTKALRSEYMLQGMKNLGPLEFNYLLNNCGPGPKMYGCQGGDFAAALSFQNNHGPGLNSQNPYIGKTGSCKNLPVSATAVEYAMLGPSNGHPSFRDIAYAIGVEHHMLATDVAAGAGQWQNYSGGIYNGCVQARVDHMINIVGYDCETSVDANGKCVFDSAGRPIKKDGYLLLQNNWGEDWGIKAGNGHGGYMKSRMYDRYGRLCNGIASDVLYFTVEVPKPPVPSPTVTPTPPAPPAKKCDKFLCSVMCWLPWC